MTAIQNNPKIRATIYLVAVTLQLAAYVVRAADKTGAWADAIQSCANFTAAVAGVTAVGNLAVPVEPQAEEPVREPAVDDTQVIPPVK